MVNKHRKMKDINPKNIFLMYMMLAFIGISCKEEIKTHDYPIQKVGITEVKLTDDFWLPKLKLIQSTTIPHAFEKCEKEGRMDNFLIAGGKMEGKTRGAMPFDDTDVYKVIEGASYSLLSLPNPELEAYLDSIISIVKTGQEDDGYLTTWRTINPDKPSASWVNPGMRWEHLAASHELYNSGHMFEAAAAHYESTGKRNFLDIALKNADLLVETFGEGKLEKVPGHQIVETGLIKLYRITNEKKYLDLAKYFLDQRGRGTRELFGPYSQDHVPVTEQDEVVGHAVRAVYMYAGMTDIAALMKDSLYAQAVERLWENMVTKKMYITGGIGSRHEKESFGDNYELPNLEAYNETCAAIGDVYWSQRMFLLTGDVMYYDVIERSLYNGLISGISLKGNDFFYPNPLEADGAFKFNQGSCTRSPWFGCSCCPTNMIRFMPTIPGLIYSTDKNMIYVNLYISNEATIPLEGTEVKIIQESDYHTEGKVKIILGETGNSAFTLKLRIPGWARNEPLPGDLYSYLETEDEPVKCLVNNNPVTPVIKEGYLIIEGDKKAGDVIELQFPVQVRHVITNEKVETNKDLVALEYGPFVYCAEEIDNPEIMDHIAIPVEGQMTLDTDTVFNERFKTLFIKDENTTLTMIPYYAWSNRGIGKMNVWFNRISTTKPD